MWLAGGRATGCSRRGEERRGREKHDRRGHGKDEKRGSGKHERKHSVEELE